MTTWKGQEFEREWHSAMIEWIDAGRVATKPAWQSALVGDEWSHPFASTPSFIEGYIYRWAPKPKRTVTINGKTLVAPEVDAPETGSTVWLLGNGHVPLVGFQYNDCTEKWIKDGEIFLTREDAQAMADWLVKCRRGET